MKTSKTLAGVLANAFSLDEMIGSLQEGREGRSTQACQANAPNLDDSCPAQSRPSDLLGRRPGWGVKSHPFCPFLC